LPHGYTYSAHPVACAAGIAALDVLVKENMVERVAKLAPYFENAVHSLKGAKHVTDIRNCGLAAGLTIASRAGRARQATLRDRHEVPGERLLCALRR